MSEQINRARRKILGLGVGLGLTLLIRPKGYASGLVSSESASKNKILSVRIWPSNVYTRLIIEASRQISAKVFTLDGPKRLVIDILNSELNVVLKKLNNKVIANDPIIEDIKVGQFNHDTIRIVIYLKQSIEKQVRSLPPINIDEISFRFRYIVDMYILNAADKNKALDDEIFALLQLDSDGSGSQNTKTDRAHTVPEFKVPVTPTSKGKILVMIDPGHGGEDPGAIGHSRTREKDIVLKIAKNLCDMINATDYMQARMTRTQDIFIPLGARVAIARQAKADVFVSVHADAFTTPAASGSSVFMLSDKGASSAFAKWLAINQNAADKIGGMSFHVKDRLVNRVLLDMTQSLTRSKSSRLGQILLSNLRQVNHLHSHSVEQAAFAVLKAPDIPSVLVETAFISNREEEELLNTPIFRDKIATALHSGLAKFAHSLLNTS